MTTLTVDQIDAQIAALEAARSARLIGKQPLQVGYDGQSVMFATVKIEDINAEIARLRMARSKLTGCSSGVGPIRVGFGDRT